MIVMPVAANYFAISQAILLLNVIYSFKRVENTKSTPEDL